MDAQQPRKRRRPGSALLVVVALFVVGAVVVWPRIAPPRAIGDASAEVIKALLAEDWTRVATLLDTVTPQTPSPVLRLLKAHACLALNRNNESLGLLLAASTDADLQAWHTWTAQLAKRHGTRAVVHYLVGDALARLRQWDSAVGALTDALRRHPNDGMALNARGIAYAAMGNLDEALVDIEEAAKANPSLAEVHTNRGALNIQRRLAPEAALASFRKALEHSPDYVLALNGRGAIGTVLNQFDEAETDLRRAAELAEGDLGALLPVIVANGLELARARDAALANMLARAGGAEPGTEMDVSYAKNHIIPSLTPQQAADYMGAIRQNGANTEYWSQYKPDKVDVTTRAHLEGGVIGKVPWIKGGVDTSATQSYSPRSTDMALNDRRRQIFDSIQQQFPDVRPTETGNVGGFLRGTMDPTGRRLSRLGGVSTEEIGDAPVEMGAWNVATMYGLVYHVTASPSASDRAGNGAVR